MPSLMEIDSTSMRKHRPRARNMPPRVTTNGWMSKWWITSPMSSPSPAPSTRTATITSGAGQPARSVDAVTMVDSATTAPTDRSMPPLRITNVIPTARTTRKALSMNRFATTCPVAKPS